MSAAAAKDFARSLKEFRKVVDEPWEERNALYPRELHGDLERLWGEASQVFETWGRRARSALSYVYMQVMAAPHDRAAVRTVVVGVTPATRSEGLRGLTVGRADGQTELLVVSPCEARSGMLGKLSAGPAASEQTRGGPCVAPDSRLIKRLSFPSQARWRFGHASRGLVFSARRLPRYLAPELRAVVH
jgi:hypothetical protein